MINNWKRLYAGTVPANKVYAAGIVPANKKYVAGTVPANKKYAAGTPKKFKFLKNSPTRSKPPLCSPKSARVLSRG